MSRRRDGDNALSTSLTHGARYSSPEERAAWRKLRPSLLRRIRVRGVYPDGEPETFLVRDVAEAEQMARGMGLACWSVEEPAAR